MRWTGWIMAAAMVAGCAGQASGGQPGCVGCVGGSALWQPNLASLSGEACCSPNGYSGVSAIPGHCCVPSQPCCANAWDGYCEHKARVQAWVNRIGTPSPRWYPCAPRRVWASAPQCIESASPAQPTPAAPPAKPRPVARPAPAAEPSPPLPNEPPVPSDEAAEKANQLWVR
jgi:hypothetical protein